MKFDVFFGDKTVKGSINLLRRQWQAEDFRNMMALMVGQYGHYLLARGLLTFVGNGVALGIKADVALATVLCGFLAKVFEQHATATLVSAAGIFQHGIDA